MLKINPDDILSMSLIELWNAIRIIILEHKNEIPPETIKKIKEGIKINVPIRNIAQEWYTIYPEYNIVNVEGIGKYNLQTFMEDMETREDLIRQILFDFIDHDPTAPRT